MDPALKTAIDDLDDVLSAAPLAATNPAFDNLKALLADLKVKLASDAATFDWRSLVPFIVVALKADLAVVTDPKAKFVLGVVIYCLGKFVPPAPAH